MSTVSSSVLGATSIEGLISGLDTTSIISSLAAVRARPITLLSNRITERSQDIQSYQALSARMLALRQSAYALSDRAAATARTVTVSDPNALVATAGATAAVGSYEIVISQLAQNHKVSSSAVADTAAALNYDGDIRLNGHTVTLEAADDLTDLRDKINRADAGVVASIMTVSPADHRLLLRSQTTGATGTIDLAEAGGGLLQGLGLLGATTSTKHALTSGMASDYLSSRTSAVSTALGLTRDLAGTIRINDTDVALDFATDSLDAIADRITATVAGVTASVTSDDDGQARLELTGASTPTLTDDANGLLETLGFLGRGVAHELQAAQDARLTLDGYEITRSTNSIDDLLTGVSLDLTDADAGNPITLRIAPNNAATVSAMQQLVSDYNAVALAINDGMEFDSDAGTGGVFFADSSILSLQSRLHDLAMGPTSTLGGDLTLMTQLGLTTDRYGLLGLNTGTLQAALEDDPQAITRLLTTQAETTDSGIEYVSSGLATGDSGSAGYAVEITRVATKATAQSAALVTLAQDETLTINGNLAISLQAGMTLEQATDKINTILTGNKLALSASVSDGRLQLQSTLYGSSFGFSVTSSLAQGVGGLDLGGLAAGSTQAYYGENVAGTIGGHAATGWGQWLTGTGDDVKDLKLLVTAGATGNHGVVKVSQGLASRLAHYAEQATDTDDGLLTRATNSVSDEIEMLTEEATSLQEGVDRYTEQLQLKFATLEGVLAKNKSLLSYLTMQVNSLQGLTTDQNA